jgi:hypothetical protein
MTFCKHTILYPSFTRLLPKDISHSALSITPIHRVSPGIMRTSIRSESFGGAPIDFCTPVRIAERRIAIRLGRLSDGWSLTPPIPGCFILVT